MLNLIFPFMVLSKMSCKTNQKERTNKDIIYAVKLSETSSLYIHFTLGRHRTLFIDFINQWVVHCESVCIRFANSIPTLTSYWLCARCSSLLFVVWILDFDIHYYIRLLGTIYVYLMCQKQWQTLLRDKRFTKCSSCTTLLTGIAIKIWTKEIVDNQNSIL